MKYLIHTLCIVLFFTGCALTNQSNDSTASNSLQNDKFIVDIYGNKINFDNYLKSKYLKTFDAKYIFEPSSKEVSIKTRDKNREIVEYDKNSMPAYVIELQKSMIIKNIKYTATYTGAENIKDYVANTIATPLTYLGNAINENKPAKPSVATMGIYKFEGGQLLGTTYNFKPKNADNIEVINPFNSEVVNKIAVVIFRSWLPSITKVNKIIDWQPGVIQIEAIDMSDTFGIFDYVLKNSKNEEENEKIVINILENNEALFSKLQNNKSQYALLKSSFLNLPSDIDLQYTKKNKDRIVQEGIYKNSKGEYRKVGSNEKIVQKTTSDTKTVVKKTTTTPTAKQTPKKSYDTALSIDTLEVGEADINFNTADDLEKSQYVDFSDGI